MHYNYASGLWVVTAYYNPVGYETRRRNYEMFARALRKSGIPLLTVECAFGNQPFDLPESMDVFKVRGKSMLWQKERLLNIAIPWLPSSCEGVAWIDCDILFTNPNWARELMDKLQTYTVLQLFETCNRLPQDLSTDKQDIATSFSSLVAKDRSILRTGQYHDHGHPGYAWAMRRSLMEKHGLYEYAIAGSADHYMAHAAVNDAMSPCIERMMFSNEAQLGCFKEWATPFVEDAQGKLGTVSGEILHLWHGELKDRRYYLRQQELARYNFNPKTDLIASPGKPLELNQGKSGMSEWLGAYFTSRKEDGVQNAA